MIRRYATRRQSLEPVCGSANCTIVRMFGKTREHPFLDSESHRRDDRIIRSEERDRSLREQREFSLAAKRSGRSSKALDHHCLVHRLARSSCANHFRPSWNAKFTR